MASQLRALVVVGTIALLSPARADDDDSRVPASIMQKELCQGVVKWCGRVEIVVPKDMPHPNCVGYNSVIDEQILNVCAVGSTCSIDADVREKGIWEIWSISRVK
jgi:hypothetical protein